MGGRGEWRTMRGRSPRLACRLIYTGPSTGAPSVVTMLFPHYCLARGVVIISEVIRLFGHGESVHRTQSNNVAVSFPHFRQLPGALSSPPWNAISHFRTEPCQPRPVDLLDPSQTGGSQRSSFDVAQSRLRRLPHMPYPQSEMRQYSPRVSEV